uniref:Uncharacterized protein LOC113797727 n=1 Tax=Dermatophagoides pteronyssinus TaxID=6956 RepID=A0A6P6YFD9_DERPT|nr:uncharacterized protein LOC113797727 [Dermatophagoides pteronyssinus]
MWTFIYYLVFCLHIFTSLAEHTAPKLGEHVSRRSQNVGTKLKITCFVQQGQKPFLFEWYKNDQLIFNDHHKYHIDSDDDTSLLAIANLNEKDSANYSCTVRNDFGFDTQTTILIIKGLNFV